MKLYPGQVIVVYYDDGIDSGIVTRKCKYDSDDVEYLSVTQGKVTTSNGALTVPFPKVNALMLASEALAAEMKSAGS